MDRKRSQHRPGRWPEKWPTPRTRRRDIALLGGLIIAAAGSLVAGVMGFRDGQPQVLGFGVLVAALFSVGAVYHFYHAVQPQRRRSDVILTTNRDGEPVTRILRSPVLFHLRTALMIGLTVLFTASAVDHYLSEGTAGVLGALIYLIIAVFFGSYVLAVATKGLMPGFIEFSPQGIFNRGWSFESRMPWRQVLTVQAEHDKKHPQVLVIGDPEREWKYDYTVRLWRIDRLTVVPMIDVDTRKFRVPPDVLYAVFSFYFDSPPARVELGTQVSLDRIDSWWPRPAA
ncbi:hypothetical protein [Hoyosella altamirensis]|uniref:Putative membrane-anchored protein n=1 Tax=Hoyosella altamirensis TaxID=616997 RepID=A0A839RQ17_9ACTN|nr:hypothetical protein [Hoyosella altamirensis]MBB3038409.1 putative membrane-anchored protein [Hoyosella altamirensis]